MEVVARDSFVLKIKISSRKNTENSYYYLLGSIYYGLVFVYQKRSHNYQIEGMTESGVSERVGLCRVQHIFR